MKIRNLTRQHGFTLIELLIVHSLIAIRAAVAIAGYIGMQNRVRRMVLIHERSFFYRSTCAKPVTRFVNPDMLCSIVII